MVLYTERPGLMIGKGGAMIKRLTENIEKKFGIENPQIDVQSVERPELNPYIMARKLASSLMRGWHFRRAGYSILRRIMNAGARGCMVVISGKLTGRRHRSVKFVDGHIKHSGEPANLWMREGHATAKVKTGVLGVKVLIMVENAKLPDDIVVVEKASREEAVEETREEVAREDEALGAQGDEQ
jgi:small subunit ribosomal protein S3